MHAARRLKDDEFYTQMADIERELPFYADHLRGKVVYCNCDHPDRSQFAAYFRREFHRLGVRRLIVTCYSDPNRDLFEPGEPEPALKLVYDGSDGASRHDHLDGTGDFRSRECRDLLDQADVVITNPPFSLFREFLNVMVRADKRFLVIGGLSALATLEFVDHYMAGRVWFGRTMGQMQFDRQAGEASEVHCLWLTNIDHGWMPPPIKLTERYSPDRYPRFDNDEAIEVSRLRDIPADYRGDMAVPVTILPRLNPGQFDVLRARYGRCGEDLRMNGQEKFFRLVIRHRRPAAV